MQDFGIAGQGRRPRDDGAWCYRAGSIGLVAVGLMLAGSMAGSAAAPRPLRSLSATLSGQIIDIVSGERLAGARIALAGGDTARTDTTGRFELEIDGDGAARTLVRRAGYYPRRLYLERANPPANLELGLIPRRGDFDLEFFDHVFRGRGRHGTDPWIDAEIDAEIWTRVFEYDATRARYVAQDRVPQQALQFARSVLEQDVPALTGGAVRVARIRMVTHAEETAVTYGQLHPPGVLRIGVSFVPGRPEFSLVASSCAGGPGSCWGAIDVHPKDMRRRAMFLHELGHVLGWDHPLGRDRVPLASIMGPRPEPDHPTAGDLLHGPVLYQRPAGSRTPDRDPPPTLAQR